MVIAVIGLLVSIALPQFTGLQGNAFDSRVESDTRFAATAQEAYYASALTYASDCGTLPGFTASPGVVFTVCSGDAAGFQLTADHPNANQTCSYDSGIAPPMTCSAK